MLDAEYGHRVGFTVAIDQGQQVVEASVGHGAFREDQEMQPAEVAAIIGDQIEDRTELLPLLLRVADHTDIILLLKMVADLADQSMQVVASREFEIDRFFYNLKHGFFSRFRGVTAHL